MPTPNAIVRDSLSEVTAPLDVAAHVAGLDRDALDAFLEGREDLPYDELVGLMSGLAVAGHRLQQRARELIDTFDHEKRVEELLASLPEPSS